MVTIRKSIVIGIVFFIVISSFASISAHAVTYSFDESSGVLYISGTGATSDSYNNNGNVKKVIIEEGISTLSSYALYNCEKLNEVELPSSLRTIYNCAFMGCKSLKMIVFPYGVEHIGDKVFSDCIELERIVLPASITSVGSDVVAGCSKLKEIHYKGTEQQWKNIGFDTSVINEFENVKICYNACDSHNWNNGVVTKSPTCIDYGVKTYTCSVCGASKEELVQKSNIHIYDIGTEVKKPDCVNTGEIIYTCVYCGVVKSEKTQPTGIHTYNEKVILPATCTNSGEKVFTCSVCEDTYTQEIAKLGHNYVKTITKATPKKNGKIVTKCSRCGNSSTKTIYAPNFVELNANTFEYDGKVKTPKVVVYDSKDEIVNKSNYTVTYSKGRKKLGTYTVTVKFKGNYSGTVKKTFRIAPKRVKVSSIKVKAASTEEISVSWGKVKGVDGYEIYRWNDKEEKYKFYKKTTKTSIKIKRDSKKYNDVYFAIRTYKKVGKKTHKSVFTHEYGWVKLSAPSFKVEQEDFNEFTLIFSHEDRYDIQISNNKDFANSDSDRTKNRWTKSYREYCKKLCFGNAKSNKKYYVRARKYYYNKKGKLVVGPWSKVTVVKPY